LYQQNVICGKLCFFASIWKKVLLKVNECCQKLMVIIFHRFIYEYCFDIIKKIILTPWRRRMSKPEKVWRWGTGNFTRSRPELNARRACRITKCWSINDFQTFESYWNDTKERKLGAVQVEAEVCRKAQNDL